ncbi:selenocysteine-specific translation elongation factor [Saccharopolyspora erythraea NRRL 2338]|uniref:Selenocysteine-specific elongation factor n=1 Tax=Saccharopolyspora erythraea (strain ATCC 11635 / DSM 40517 / JCM 4748 / NBRC 13426 / NCIMB 8594 / NRRL 2338) TaxID=405948 RepID=A4FFK0_SACEN|nr:translation elongation factor [Saccharopolyspora erythraea D]CAM02825.1 selenocysteine-specific translation elongation factor [Saccharopolyspora erythraea NRRL 2338]
MMHVVATAGHVDHGKSTLVRALTGMEPDRWSEERRRGLTIDLGFAWTTLADGCTVAFVDVPGHHRFVPNMLAGIGPVPAVLFVVAADEGWMPQSTEHLEALDALGVRHGLLAVTRCDLADPEPAIAEARDRLDQSSLAHSPVVRVSGATGAGLDDLRGALDELLHRLPAPDPDADVRLWVDRAFTIRGAGTVVTATLAAGTLRTGMRLRLGSSGRGVAIRGMQALGSPVQEARAVSRVAVNLRGVEADDIGRGDVLLSPGRWLDTDLVDVRLSGSVAKELPRELALHIGSASVPVRVRPLDVDTARLALRAPLPLRIGDRALLRESGGRQARAGALVLDVRPPALDRRGAAQRRALELATMDGRPDGAAELRRRRVVRADELRAMGAVPPAGGDWLIDPAHRDQLAAELTGLLDRHRREHPLEDGVPAEMARRALDLPDPDLLPVVLAAPAASGISLDGGRLRLGPAPLPEPLRRALATVRDKLTARPFEAPTADELTELGVGEKELAAAERAGELLRIAPGIVLLPGADDHAVDLLSELPAPFTVSQARRALGTTRRVAVVLLEFLARRGRTRRLPDGTHQVVSRTR